MRFFYFYGRKKNTKFIKNSDRRWDNCEKNIRNTTVISHFCMMIPQESSSFHHEENYVEIKKYNINPHIEKN